MMSSGIWKSRLICSLLVTVFVILVSSANAQETAPADLVLINGKIITVDNDLPEAEAVAIQGDMITAVGTTAEIRKFIAPNTRVIDLKGRLAVPGLVDSHAHFLGVGYARMKLGLSQTKNWTEIVAMVADEVARREPGEWITGRGWHQDKWDKIPQPNIDGLPVHHDLSEISPDNPVLLTHASGHSCIANANAMKLAGISAESIDPDGGKIIRDASGQPIGVFLETAMDSLYAAIDKSLENRSDEETERVRRKAIELATEECLSKGLTGFHDAGQPFEIIDLYRKMADEGNLGIRLYAMISEVNDSLVNRIDDYKIIGAGNNFLTVRSIKRLIDGALGSHGAWLLEPYLDLPQSTGLNTETIEDLTETARIASEHGFQLCTHAIGDRGNREILDIYESIINQPEKKDLRWRVEHAQHLHPDDIQRFGQLDVIAAMQTVHCTSDGPWVDTRLGDKRVEEGAYVWRKLISSGAMICNGTDAPVEDTDPLENFYAAVTRILPNGKPFYADQCMSREEALQSYTINAAYAGFMEDIKGSITPGKLADVTIFSKDIMTIPPDEILTTHVLYTIVGGKIMYKYSE